MTQETSIVIRGSELGSRLACLVDVAFGKAQALDSRLPEPILSMPGMSGRKYRRLINALIGSLPDARYLEIGSWAGSTACSAMFANRLKITCIDNWSEFGGPKDVFFNNIAAVRSDLHDFDFRESDFRAVDYGTIGTFNVYLFDGPHEYQDQFDGVAGALGALDDEFVLIVDDWNFERVREGTRGAIRANSLTVRYGIEIRTTQDGTHGALFGPEGEWHNGYFIAVLRKAG